MLSREEAEARADAALEQLGITDLKHRHNHKLSGGEKRMAAIATILAMEPDAILMDEPTAALDPYNRRVVINTINSLRNSGDHVLRIEAVLSGTLNFIFNTISADIPFSQTVRMAKEQGYSEPDPRVDLSGTDVVRKLVILSREAGYEVNQENVEAEPFIPKEFFQCSLDEFWQKLPTFTIMKHYYKSFQIGLSDSQSKDFIYNFYQRNISSDDRLISLNVHKYSLFDYDSSESELVEFNIKFYSVKKYNDISRTYKKITEMFLQNFILFSSNLLIIVVGQLTFSEQKLIERIKGEVQKQRVIFIIT
jgi:hypothetical protein